MSIHPQVGTVVQVEGHKVFIEWEGEREGDARFQGGRYTVDGEHFEFGRIGSYIRIGSPSRFIVATVTSIRIDPVENTPGMDSTEGSLINRRTGSALLLGHAIGGEFRRGVREYPMPGDPVYILHTEELKSLLRLEVNAAGAFAPGKLSSAGDMLYVLDANKLCGRHCAIVGSTGSGKSWTVARILELLEERKNPHVVVFDLHGEYGTALSEAANRINLEDAVLPYWLLNIDEIVELFVDRTEENAPNQNAIMRREIRDLKVKWVEENGNPVDSKRISVDSPIPYSFKALLERLHFLDETDRDYSKSDKGAAGPYNKKLTRMIDRMETRLQDVRYNFMFGENDERMNSQMLDTIMEQLIGLGSHTGKVTCLDLSGVPSEVVGTVVAVLTRLIFDFTLWNHHRRECPILLVLEEAHQYIPADDSARFVAARAQVERVAKEGRKYGVGLMVVSQRPRDLSPTVVSQCGTFVAMRLTNPDDQAYVRRYLPDAMADVMDVLPSLETGEAIVLGEATPLPVRLTLVAPKREPQSHDVDFWRWWNDGVSAEMSVPKIVRAWRERSRATDKA